MIFSTGAAELAFGAFATAAVLGIFLVSKNL
jgi:hypothetical protein